MNVTGLVRRFDDLGRIVVPRECRRLMFGTEHADGMSVDIYMDGKNVILRPCEKDIFCNWTVSGSENNILSYHTDCGMERLKPLEGSFYCDHCGKQIRIKEAERKLRIERELF